MIALKKGDRVSEYILEESLGRGGFGEVWRARHHLWDDREVAIKIPTSPEAVSELSNEGALQSGLAHPGIARTLGMDPSADPPYFITEFVPGENLRQILERTGPFPVGEVRELLEQMLDILEYAHGQGVVHQDIKPENVLRTAEHRIKLTDFGLGQNLNGESILLSASLRSAGGAIGGTFPYIAPEIRDGQGALDGRADLYSLGILMFELLTGKRPAGGEVPSDLTGDLPRWCDEVFRGLYTRRDNRFENVAAVRRSLEEASSAGAGSAAASAEASAGPRVIPISPPQHRIPTKEARRILNMSKREIRHLVKDGRLTPYTIKGRLHFDAAQVQQFKHDHPTVTTSTDEGRFVGAKMTPKLGKPVADPVGFGVEVADQYRSAGLFLRAVAMFSDWWIMAMLCFFVGTSSMLVPFVSPVTLMVPILYFTLCHGLWGQTFGKMILGIKVIHQDGRPLNVFDGFIRSINYVLSALPLGLGFLCVVFSQRRLAFHDVVCRTRVVHVRR